MKRHFNLSRHKKAKNTILQTQLYNITQPGEDYWSNPELYIYFQALRSNEMKTLITDKHS